MSLQNTNITLKSLQFQHATIFSDDVFLEYVDNFGLSFKLANQNETRYYVCHGQEKREVQYEFIKGLPTISIESFTEETLDLDDDIEVI
jgi:hypothetical protein